MPLELDDIDRTILKALQRDGRRQNIDLARAAGLSPSPCLRRVKILEEAGVIERYVAILNPVAIGLSLTVFVRITLDRQDTATVERFIKEIQKASKVLECHLLSGDWDFLLRVAVADLADYQDFVMDQLSRIPGVRNVKTDIPLQTVKQTTAYPL